MSLESCFHKGKESMQSLLKGQYTQMGRAGLVSLFWLNLIRKVRRDGKGIISENLTCAEYIIHVLDHRDTVSTCLYFFFSG